MLSQPQDSLDLQLKQAKSVRTDSLFSVICKRVNNL